MAAEVGVIYHKFQIPKPEDDGEETEDGIDWLCTEFENVEGDEQVVPVGVVRGGGGIGGSRSVLVAVFVGDWFQSVLLHTAPME